MKALLALIAIALTLPAIQSEPGVAKVKREIEVRHARLADAHVKRDIEAILTLKTSDFHAVGPDERVPDTKTMINEPGLLLAKLEVATGSARASSQALIAWKLRDADLFMRGIPKEGFNLKKADGTKMTWDDLYASQKTRMAMIKHIDHLIVTIDVESVSATSAVVLSTQDWSRVVSTPNGTNTRLITGVTHREIWSKASGEWKMETFTEENQTSKVEENVTVPEAPEKYEIVMKLTENVRR